MRGIIIQSQIDKLTAALFAATTDTDRMEISARRESLIAELAYTKGA